MRVCLDGGIVTVMQGCCQVVCGGNSGQHDGHAMLCNMCNKWCGSVPLCSQHNKFGAPLYLLTEREKDQGGTFLFQCKSKLT
eukprot:4104788-Ditylum_brightwellii.AAC.2